MHLKEVNDATGHRIVSGADYQWNCYTDARLLDYEFDSGTASVVYSTATQQIYEANVALYGSGRPYRWLNPETKDAMFQESTDRNQDAAEAWDGVKWIDLETEADFLNKLTAIVNGEPYDERIVVPIELSDDDFLSMAKLAHERDITFNEMVAVVLRDMINREKASASKCGNDCAKCKCSGD